MFLAILVTAVVVLVLCTKTNLVDFLRFKLGIKVKHLIKYTILGLSMLLITGAASASHLVFVGAAHTNGSNGSVWRSNLFVLPMTCEKPPWEGGQGCVVNYTLTGYGRFGESASISGTVDASVGMPIPVQDVFSLLGLTDSSGVLIVDSDSDIDFSWMKTYTLLANGGTFGQLVLPSTPLTPLATYVTAPSIGRVGLWFYNASDTPGVVKIGDTDQYFILNPGVDYFQFPSGADILKFVAGLQPPWGSGIDSNAVIYLTVTAVDNITNDGVTVPIWMTDSGE